MLPSIKTLTLIAGPRAKELRKVLEITTREELESLPGFNIGGMYSIAYTMYERTCNRLQLTSVKLAIADEILETYGVEYIPAGRGKRSPAIEYCNTGDTYALTLCYISGVGYRVTSWGDIVEQGNYE